MIWSGWRSGCEFVMKNATTKQIGPQVNYETQQISTADYSNSKQEEQTAVTVSMHSTKGSLVRYLESEKAYSFHNWPKMSCAGPIRV